MIKLYTFPASSNSRKVRIALIEKGLEFERIPVDLSKREQKNPDYSKIHPFGLVPALDDEGFIVYDSTIINEYLEDEYPYPPLLPKETRKSSSRRGQRSLSALIDLRRNSRAANTWLAHSALPTSHSFPTSIRSIGYRSKLTPSTKTSLPGLRG